MKNEEATRWLTNLKKDIGKLEHKHLWHYEQALDEIIKLLSNQQKTGEWIVCGDGESVPYLCSHCGKTVSAILIEKYPHNYCPNCGAKMTPPKGAEE